MEKKLVLDVPMHCRKCRTKALKIAAVAQGVTSVALEGESQKQLVVIGEGVDPVCLVRALRKKVGYTQILNFGPPSKKDAGNENQTDTAKETHTSCACQHNWQPVYTVSWIDPYPCSIL